MTNRIFLFGERCKGKSIRVEYSFLCEFADRTEADLLNVFSAGIRYLSFAKLPEKRPIVLAMSLQYDPVEESGSHSIEIRLLDSDGKNEIEPVAIDAEFPSDTRFYELNSKLRPVFHKFDTYSVEVRLDGRSIVSIPLDVVIDR